MISRRLEPQDNNDVTENMIECDMFAISMLSFIESLIVSDDVKKYYTNVLRRNVYYELYLQRNVRYKKIISLSSSSVYFKQYEFAAKFWAAYISYWPWKFDTV